MFFSVFVFFPFYFFSFSTEIVLSISFRKLTKTAIKRYSTTYICFQFDKPYKIMQSFSNILWYPGNLSMWFQRCCQSHVTSRRRLISNQRWNNVVYVIVEIYNFEQLQINIDINNVMQSWNNALIFNVRVSWRWSTSKQRCEYDHPRKVEKRKKKFFELQKKDGSFD